MKKYAVFKRTIQKNENVLTITYAALMNPADLKSVMQLEADSAQVAALTAADLFKKLGVKTHTVVGDPDTVTYQLPDYFVGEIRANAENFIEMFRIDAFVPIPNIER